MSSSHPRRRHEYSGRPVEPQTYKMHNAQEVTVHARASTDGSPSPNPLQSQPSTTCFGFRRRSKGPADPVMWVKNPTSATEEAKQPAKQPAPPKAKAAKPGRQRLCGMRDILCSFGSDIFDTQSHRHNQAAAAQPTAPRERPSVPAEKAAALDSKDSARSVDSTPTPKIMASYDSLFVESQRGAAEADNTREKEDGADSISIADTIEDEGYDSFGAPKWTIDPHDIFFISKGDGSNKVCRLGKGDYGPVYLGVWQEQEVAVKLARQTPISLKTERQFQANVALLHGLSHANIVPFLGACCWKGGKRSVMVTEFMDKSDLRTLLGKADLAPKFAWREHGQTVALDIAHGLQYLHGRGMAHGRLKCGNVLMNKAGVAKLSDVSLSTLLSHCKTVASERAARLPAGAGGRQSTEIGPPEGVKEGGSMSGDIFCFGLVLHELLTHRPPAATRLRAIKTPEEAPAKIAYLVECCLEEDPQARPSIDRVVSILAGRRS